MAAKQEGSKERSLYLRRHEALAEPLPRVTGTVVEETDDLWVISSGPRLLEVPKASVKRVGEKKLDEGRRVELTLEKDAQLIQSTLFTPGKSEVIAAELFGLLRIDEIASNCNCNCNCDSGSNCNCNCNCDCSDCSGKVVGQFVNPALLRNLSQFQRTVERKVATPIAIT